MDLFEAAARWRTQNYEVTPDGTSLLDADAVALADWAANAIVTLRNNSHIASRLLERCDGVSMGLKAHGGIIETRDVMELARIVQRLLKENR